MLHFGITMVADALFVLLLISTTLGSPPLPGLYFCDPQVHICRMCSKQQLIGGLCPRDPAIKYWKTSRDCSRRTRCHSTDTPYRGVRVRLQQPDQDYFYCPGVGGVCIKCSRFGLGAPGCPAGINLWPTSESCNSAELRCGMEAGGLPAVHAPNQNENIGEDPILFYCEAFSGACRSCQQSQCGALSVPGGQFWRRAADCVLMEPQCSFTVDTIGITVAPLPHVTDQIDYYHCSSSDGRCVGCSTSSGLGIPDCPAGINLWPTQGSCEQSEPKCFNSDASEGISYQCDPGGQCRVCGTGNGACLSDQARFPTKQACAQQCSGSTSRLLYQCPTRGLCTTCSSALCAAELPAFATLQECLSNSQCRVGGSELLSSVQLFQCRVPGQCSVCQSDQCALDIPRFNSLTDCLNSEQCSLGGVSPTPATVFQCPTPGMCQSCQGSSCVLGIAYFLTMDQCLTNVSCRTGSHSEVSEIPRSLHYCDPNAGSCISCAISTGEGGCPASTNLWRTDGQCRQMELNCGAVGDTNLASIQPSSTQSKCQLERSKANPALIGSFVPVCLDSGNYASVQCHGSTGLCWCVRQDSGELVPGTMKPANQPPPDCATF